tara:strand:+ start:368 stop:553 length:186 start_codon:yes stop_codon:yes gene_type:complete
MKTIITLLAIITLSSCGFTSKLTNEQLERRNKLDYEANKLWNEYQYKVDSLYIEYHKIKTK